MNEYILITTIVILVLLFPIAIAAYSFAPWVPSRLQDITRIFNLSKLQPNETFVELGCGNARVLLAIAARHKGPCIGVERAWPLALIAKLRTLIIPHSHIKVYTRNLFNYNLANADVIYTFGMPKALPRLGEKIKRECKKGTRIISYTFPISNLTLLITDQPSSKSLSIYVYKL